MREGVFRVGEVFEGNEGVEGNEGNEGIEGKYGGISRGQKREIGFLELFHHLTDCYGLEMIRAEEERNAVYYAKTVLEKARTALV